MLELPLSVPREVVGCRSSVDISGCRCQDFLVRYHVDQDCVPQSGRASEWAKQDLLEGQIGQARRCTVRLALVVIRPGKFSRNRVRNMT